MPGSPADKDELTPESFDRLLAWLDPDCTTAAEEYERIRRLLIKFFAGQRRSDPESLADRTISRVARILPRVVDTYVGSRDPFFRKVAGYILHEYPDPFPSPPVPPSAPVDPDGDGKELQLDCLDRCMGLLSQDERLLVFGYFEDDKRAKIDHRKRLAAKLGGLNALRIKIYRIKRRLRTCVEECVNRKLETNLKKNSLSNEHP